VDIQNPNPTPETSVPATASSAALPPVSLGDEAQLKAANPALAAAVEARLASWDVFDATVDSADAESASVTLSDGRKGKVHKKAFGIPAPVAGQKTRVLLEGADVSGELILTHDKAEKLRLWAAASIAAEQQLMVEGVVVAKSGGGLSVDIGVRAFLPANQSGVARGQDLEQLVGQKLVFGISEFDRRTGVVELARKALVQAERAERKKATMDKLKEGAVLEGVVKNLTDYGAFIDLGGIDGLLHVSDMSWSRVKHPREVVTSGDAIRVQVLKHDEKAGKISLGLKQLEIDPWVAAASKLTVGQTVKGKVLRLVDFGAFLEIEPGFEGLAHVSEMSWTRVKHPNQLVKEGQEVETQVLEIDLPQRRLRLGMKQLQKNPWTVVEEQYPVGTVLKSTVRSVVDYGLFVGMQEGIDGFVHVSDLSWTQRVRHPGDLYKVGDELEVVVLNIDLENERLSLGVKQTQPDPWIAIAERHAPGSKLKGRVTRVTPFGAFVEVEPGIEGLVHVSELRNERVEHPDDVVQENEIIDVTVLDVDTQAHKISLSARPATQPDDYRQFMNDPTLGKVSLGEVLGAVFADKSKK
jgi:small subunit ribosomal protein S1